ncbi:MAG: HNH endonuclease signature motif containing protein, partial [Brachymonas denitrificans]
RKQAAGGTHTAEDVADLFRLQRGKCACCRTSIKRCYHVDHIEPLARGGSNDRTNLQLLCPTCNTRKSAKHPIEFMQSRGLLL